MSKFASKMDLLRLIDLPNVKIEVDMLLDMNYLPSGKWIIGLHDAKSNDLLQNAFTKLKNSSRRFFDIQACPGTSIFNHICLFIPLLLLTHALVHLLTYLRFSSKLCISIQVSI